MPSLCMYTIIVVGITLGKASMEIHHSLHNKLLPKISITAKGYRRFVNIEHYKIFMVFRNFEMHRSRHTLKHLGIVLDNF